MHAGGRPSLSSPCRSWPPDPPGRVGLDLRVWLERPGVRLVAVEFYATWCAPCMEAVPRWKALHERYRGKGLRLIVVNTQDPEGQCMNPGWNPDEMVCDPDVNHYRLQPVVVDTPSSPR